MLRKSVFSYLNNKLEFHGLAKAETTLQITKRHPDNGCPLIDLQLIPLIINSPTADFQQIK